MRGRNKINMYFIISELCLIIFPITFLFMPITNSDMKNLIMAIKQLMKNMKKEEELLIKQKL